MSAAGTIDILGIVIAVDIVLLIGILASVVFRDFSRMRQEADYVSWFLATRKLETRLLLAFGLIAWITISAVVVLQRVRDF